MITEYIIQFRTKRPNDGVHHQIEQWSRTLVRMGYLVRGRHTHHRDPDDRRLVTCCWTMTGRGAFSHAWNKEDRDPHDFGRSDIRESLDKEPRVVQLLPSIEHYSCKCKKNEAPTLNLWCTPSSGYPPLMCSKGGCIAMYKLPLSMATLYKLEQWNELATGMAMGHFQMGQCPKQWKAFEKEQTESQTSDFRKLSLQVAKDVERESGRKVNAFDRPYHIFKL